MASLFFLNTVCYGTPVLPVGRMENEFVYDRFERLQTLEYKNFDYQIGPYALDKAEFDIAPLYYFKQEPSERLTLFAVGTEDYRATGKAASRGYESLRGGLVAHPFEKLFVYGNFVLDEKRAADLTYSGKKWRGLAGDVEQAFAYYRTDRFNLTFGRFASFWGPRNSLVLSANVALDGAAYSINWGRLTLSYRLARLNGLNPDKDSVAQFENRYFAGHRLDVHFNNGVRVGFFETVIFGGPGRQIELYYLNPILFFHGSQLNEGADDNTFVGFDFDYVPIDGIRFFGQLLIDDLQIEKKSQGDQEPNELGLSAGVHWVNAFNKTDFKASYTRVSNRTYNQGNERNRYLYNGELLSAALGNDYDQWLLSVLRWINNSLNFGINMIYTRQGEGNVTDLWTTPWLNITGNYREAFPTGIVTKTTRLSLGLKGFFGKFLFTDLETGVDLAKNFEHRAGDNQTRPFVNVKISTFFSGAIDVE